MNVNDTLAAWGRYLNDTPITVGCTCWVVYYENKKLLMFDFKVISHKENHTSPCPNWPQHGFNWAGTSVDNPDSKVEYIFNDRNVFRAE